MRWLLIHLAAFALAIVFTAGFAWIESGLRAARRRRWASGGRELLAPPASNLVGHRPQRRSRTSVALPREFATAQRKFYVR